MKELIDDACHFHTASIGIMAGQEVIHMAPTTNRVPKLIGDLLIQLDTTDQYSLIASSVFHYEFEFIHPFADGNGRMGRLWQTILLSHWNPIFTHIPVVSLIHLHQAVSQWVINESTQLTDPSPFITLMLQMILDVVTSPPQIEQLLCAMNGEMSREKIHGVLGRKDRNSFRERYLQSALADGLIEITVPDKPGSRLQKQH